MAHVALYLGSTIPSKGNNERTERVHDKDPFRVNLFEGHFTSQKGAGNEHAQSQVTFFGTIQPDPVPNVCTPLPLTCVGYIASHVHSTM